MKIQSIKAHLQELVTMPGAKGTRIRVLIGPQDGACNFCMRQFEVEPGGCTPHHQHDYEHEILVLKGSGIAKTPEGDRPFKVDDVIFVPAGAKHGFCNNTDETCEFLCLIPSEDNCGCSTS